MPQTTFTRGDLLELIEEYAKDYRRSANASLRRNGHMNGEVMNDRKDLPQEVVDALIVDFINYVGSRQGLDYGMHVKHFFEGKPSGVLIHSKDIAEKYIKRDF